MLPKCSVLSCSTKIFGRHAAPRDESARAEWQKALREHQGFVPDDKHFFICNQHFPADAFHPFFPIDLLSRRRLRRGAIPVFSVAGSTGVTPAALLQSSHARMVHPRRLIGKVSDVVVAGPPSAPSTVTRLPSAHTAEVTPAALLQSSQARMVHPRRLIGKVSDVMVAGPSSEPSTVTRLPLAHTAEVTPAALLQSSQARMVHPRRLIGKVSDVVVAGPSSAPSTVTRHVLQSTTSIGVQCNIKKKTWSRGTQSKPAQADKAISFHGWRSMKRKFTAFDYSTPVKRQRLDFSKFSPIFSPQNTKMDKTFTPNTTNTTVDTDISIVEDPLDIAETILVEKRQLIKLLNKCRLCQRSTTIKFHKVGFHTKIDINCSFCENVFRWASSQHNSEKFNSINCAAMYATSNPITSVNSYFESIKLSSISQSQFNKIIRRKVGPSINYVWQQQQNKLLEKNENLSLAGDMRADSPGHCAKFGTYTIMDVGSSKILHTELVQSNEVNGSNHMEKEGLVRALDFLEQRGKTVDTLVTDRHPTIQKFLREEKGHISHKFDSWHISKAFEAFFREVVKSTLVKTPIIGSEEKVDGRSSYQALR